MRLAFAWVLLGLWVAACGDHVDEALKIVKQLRN